MDDVCSVEEETGKIDWRNEDAIKELTRAIIFFKFKGKITNYDIPKGYLCPRVP